MALIDATDSALAEALEPARVGWRFTVVGSGHHLEQVRARVTACGALDTELTCISVDGDSGYRQPSRHVFCAHCRTVTVTAIRIGDVMRCGGCDSMLTVYYHYSRRHHAYMGYRADSEELM
ncbi:hypothetical protein I1A62_26260 [Rhodococcus sp. USK10]|nr:hypothetical protein I1A62_26260 [Rhodococcus sp. USK10]